MIVSRLTRRWSGPWTAESSSGSGQAAGAVGNHHTHPGAVQAGADQLVVNEPGHVGVVEHPAGAADRHRLGQGVSPSDGVCHISELLGRRTHDAH